MKKLLFLLALGAATPVLAQNPAPAIFPAPVGAVAPFNWQVRLVKGQKFRTTVDGTTKKSEQDGALPGEAAKAPVQTTETEHLVFDQEVLSSDEKGARIELIYREAKRTSDEIPDEDDKPTPESIDFKAGARFRYTVSPDGKMSDVQGIEEFMARIMAAYDQTQIEEADDPTLAQLAKTLREGVEADFRHDAQQDMLGKSLGTLPGAPIVPGQNWTYDADLPDMMGLEFKEMVTATFVGREGESVTLGESAVLSTNGNKAIELAAPDEPGDAATNVKIAYSGTKQGQVKVDEKTGIVRFRHSTEQSQAIFAVANVDEQGDKKEDVIDTVEETTWTTEILPPDTIVALPVAAPAP